jgi:hypothetical protein
MRGYGDLNLPVPITPDIQPVPGVSTDDSGMSVVTVVGTPSTGLPWWVWVLGIGALIYFGGRK